MSSDNWTNPFEQLPIEILLKIFSYLNPEQLALSARTNKQFKIASSDNFLWEQKLKRHFPHVFYRKILKQNVNWYSKFYKAYNNEYIMLPIHIIKLFSFVKEGDVANLKSTVTLKDLNEVDSNDVSLLEWAQEKGNQDLLDYFYQLVIHKYSLGFTLNTKKGEPNARTILHWAILCRQPVETINLLIMQGANINAVANGHTPIIEAAIQGQADIVDLLITQGAHINDRTIKGATPLLVAVENNHKSVVDVLLKYNADTSIPLRARSEYHTNFKVEPSDTPLHAAVKLGRIDLVTALLDNGADINALAKGHAPIIDAAEQGQAVIMDLLITRGANINARSTKGATPLLFAIENNHKNVIDILLKHHADTSIPLQASCEYHTTFKIELGDTPLHAAVKLGRIDLVTALLDNGANINAVLVNVHTPLIDAAIQGQADIVDLLIKRGAHINARSNKGATPLLLAIENNHKNVVDILLKYNADTSIPLRASSEYHNDFKVEPEDTPLHAAVKLGRIDLVTALLDNGADINALAKGRTPIMDAAIQGQADIIDLLIRRGTNINARSTQGATPLLLAIENNHKSAVDVLLKYNADTSIPLQASSEYHANFKVEVGDTPLHAASKLGSVAIIQRLLNKKANIQARNGQNQTPIDVAMKGSRYANELRLLEYLEKIENRTQDYKTFISIPLFNKKIYFGCSAQEKKNAALALKSVTFESAPKSSLKIHKKALNNGELETIYHRLQNK